MFVVTAEERHRDSRPLPISIVVESLDDAKKQAEEWLNEPFWSIENVRIYRLVEVEEVVFAVDQKEIETVTKTTHKEIVFRS